jgi:hypothetical protein
MWSSGESNRIKYIAVRIGDVHQLQRNARHTERATRKSAPAKMLPIEIGETRHPKPRFPDRSATYELTPAAVALTYVNAMSDMIIVRYADDIIVGFEHESEARQFCDAMRKRLESFLLPSCSAVNG